MTSLPGDGTEHDALGAVAFLANSDNRLRVLEALAAAPRRRPTLQEETDVNKVTLGRILDDLEETCWIVRAGQQYRVTPLGEQVIEAFSQLLALMEVGGRLGDVLTWFPPHLVTFDLRRLEDADVSRRSATDITALERRIARAYAGADRIRVLSYQVSPALVRPFWRLAVEEGRAIEAVAAPALFEAALADAEMATMVREIAESGNAALYVVDAVPIQVALLDDVGVVIGLTDDEDTLQAVVQSEDEAVRGWALDLFETTRARAEPLDLDDVGA